MKNTPVIQSIAKVINVTTCSKVVMKVVRCSEFMQISLVGVLVHRHGSLSSTLSYSSFLNTCHLRKHVINLKVQAHMCFLPPKDHPTCTLTLINCLTYCKWKARFNHKSYLPRLEGFYLLA